VLPTATMCPALGDATVQDQIFAVQVAPAQFISGR
jgi:hypothetical protein